MSKYLELFKGAFDDSIGTKTKPENKPYIGYSLTEGKMAYTVIPKPVVGPADNEIWYTSSDGNIVTPAPSELDANIVSNTYENGKGVIVFDGPVTSMGQGTFQYSNTLTSIIIPSSVTSIASPVFPGCYALTSIIVEAGNTVYDSRENCNAIIATARNILIHGCKNTIIPDGVTIITDQAFFENGSVSSITIPRSVTIIGVLAFGGCPSLNSITFEGTMDEWNSISKRENWNFGAPATYVQCSDGQVAL